MVLYAEGSKAEDGKVARYDADGSMLFVTHRKDYGFTHTAAWPTVAGGAVAMYRLPNGALLLQEVLPDLEAGTLKRASFILAVAD